ncbi:MAG TPA: hypothetical protein VMV07_25475 [Streptosporangiaceae bacterium]|nr:hypothetical protein [Streptosporangiaceae bacterium]
MILFRVVLSVVVAAAGLLVAGVVSGSLLVVDLAIGVAALGLVMLIIGVVVWREEILGGSSAQGQEEPAAGALTEAEEPSESPLPVGLVVGGTLDAPQLADERGVGERVTGERRRTGVRPEPPVRSAPAELWMRRPAVEPEPSSRTAAPESVQSAAAASVLPPQTVTPGARTAQASAAGALKPSAPAADISAQSDPPSASRPDGPPSVDELLRRAGRSSAQASVTGSVGRRESGPRESGPRESGPLLPGPAPVRSPSPPAKPVSAAEPELAKPAVAADAVSAGSIPAQPAPTPAPSAAATAESAMPATPAIPAAPATPAAPAPASDGDSPSAQPMTADDEEAADDQEAEGAEEAEEEQVTVVPGIGRYHLPGCILIRFLGTEDLQVMARQAAEASGCVPCKACRPEK